MIENEPNDRSIGARRKIISPMDQDDFSVIRPVPHTIRNLPVKEWNLRISRWKKSASSTNIIGQAPGITAILLSRHSCTALDETLVDLLPWFSLDAVDVPPMQCIQTRRIPRRTHSSTTSSDCSGVTAMKTPSTGVGSDARSA